MTATIRSVRRLETRVEAYDWRWERENRELIRARWARRVAELPRLFDGTVLLAHEVRVEEGVFRATFFPVPFSSFLVFRDEGFPAPGVVNVFALAALRSADGAWVLGVQGAHTANAGRAYFPAGTPDLADVRDDRVDLEASVMRELREETGLGPDSCTPGDDWTVVDVGPMAALFRPLELHDDAATVERRVRAHIAREPEPELAGVRLVRGPADIDPSVMPAYLIAFLRDVSRREG